MTLAASIVIPTYNRRKSLLRTLSGLASQSAPANTYEVIVVSDGSSDSTAQAVQELQVPFCLRLLEQKNQGPSAARNRGMEAAEAGLLIYLDDDVEPVPAVVQEHIV